MFPLVLGHGFLKFQNRIQILVRILIGETYRKTSWQNYSNTGDLNKNDTYVHYYWCITYWRCYSKIVNCQSLLLTTILSYVLVYVQIKDLCKSGHNFKKSVFSKCSKEG